MEPFFSISIPPISFRRVLKNINTVWAAYVSGVVLALPAMSVLGYNDI